VIRESFKPVTSTYISDEMIDHLMKQFSSNQAYRLFDDVLPFFKFLKATRRKHREEETALAWPWRSTTVGIITNSDPRVPDIFRSLGLSVRQDRREEQQQQKNLSDISFVTMSYNVGFEKPHVQIFQAAEMAFAELPIASQISGSDVVKVHVGDDMEQDTFGAMDTGWNAIFLDREERFRNEWLMAGAEKPTLSITEKGTEVTVIKDLGVLSFWSQELTN
jgi:FMN phosphatase YigB (HAD superfamily)